MRNYRLQAALDRFDEAVNWKTDNILHAQGGMPADLDEGVCCVGVRMAMHLKVEQDSVKPLYLAGVDRWMEEMQGNRAHAIILLRQAGACHDPFSGRSWPKSVDEVLEKLAKTESMPWLISQDFNNTNLSNANLDYAAFVGSQFKGAHITASTLKYAKMNSAVLVEADLRDSKFIRADLTRAQLNTALVSRTDFCDAVLVSANMQYHRSGGKTDFTRASMVAADLEGARLRDCNFGRADLTGAIFKKASIERSNFDGAKLIGTDFTDADMHNTSFHGAVARGVVGLDFPTQSRMNSQATKEEATNGL